MADKKKKGYYDNLDENEDFISVRNGSDGVSVLRKSKKDPKVMKRVLKASSDTIDAAYKKKRDSEFLEMKTKDNLKK